MKKALLFLIYIGWIVLIFSFSLQDATESGALSGRFITWIENVFWSIDIDGSALPLSFIVRKMAHFTEFLILGSLGYWLFIHYLNKANKAFIMSVLIGFVIAALDETIQTNVPGRSGNFIDVMIDWLGVLVGTLILGYMVWNKLQKKEQSSD